MYCRNSNSGSAYNTTIEEIIAPKCQSIDGYAAILSGLNSLKKLVLGSVNFITDLPQPYGAGTRYGYAFRNTTSLAGAVNLVHLEFGADGTEQNATLNLNSWNPTNALSTTATNLIEDTDKGFTCNLD